MTDQRQMQEPVDDGWKQRIEQGEQELAELRQEQVLFELAIVQRIERGLATVEDARYVAASFGLTTTINKEKQHGKH